jgi:hypothetical protein
LLSNGVRNKDLGLGIGYRIVSWKVFRIIFGIVSSQIATAVARVIGGVYPYQDTTHIASMLITAVARTISGVYPRLVAALIDGILTTVVARIISGIYSCLITTLISRMLITTIAGAMSSVYPDLVTTLIASMLITAVAWTLIVIGIISNVPQLLSLCRQLLSYQTTCNRKFCPTSTRNTARSGDAEGSIDTIQVSLHLIHISCIS